MISAMRCECSERSKSIKQRLVGLHHAAGSGHLGSSLSIVEILTFIRFAWWSDGDDLILSKGHAATALYSLLVEDGSIPAEQLSTYYQNGTLFAAHPPPNRLPRIPFATGSLGHGLSLAAGMAMARQIKRQQTKVFCVTSDGELNEGSIWEAALFIAHHNLRNVVWLIDRNGIQGFGRTEDVLRMEPLAEKLSAFGFNPIAADGHDFDSLEIARQEAMKSTRPAAIICRTTKGNGWGGMQDTVDCHYLPISAKDRQSFVDSLVSGSERSSQPSPP
jgi:transketolase